MLPDTLQSLLARPDLPRLARAINETLQRERVRRERFRRELTPSVKAEFIGGEIVRHSPAKAKHLRATQNLGRPCSKLGYKKCPKKHFKCMEDQDIDKIASAVKDILK